MIYAGYLKRLGVLLNANWLQPVMINDYSTKVQTIVPPFFSFDTFDIESLFSSTHV